jgi:uncharacterized protein (PEP-CTERM system associated)
MPTADTDPVGRLRRGCALTGCAVALALQAGPAAAQSPWRVSGSVAGQLSYTNNVDLQRGAAREGDFVLSIAPRMQVSYEAARAALNGWVSVPIHVYAQTSENNSVSPQANLVGHLEMVKDFFFVEASANVSQTYFNPFGPQPPGLINATDNRYTTASYRVSPYIKGTSGGSIRYSLRDDNVWTSLGGAPVGANNVYSNSLVGTIERDPAPLGWGVDLNRAEHDFNDQRRTQVLELVRARGIYRYSAAWQFAVSGGYERNRFPLSDTESAIYGVGIVWRPTERTKLDAAWEHRFFGGSYRVEFQHRGPRSSWSLRASRDITTYPEQIAQLPAGSSVSSLLNDILLSRISDPAQRAEFIANYIRDRGLPDVIADPISLYTQQIYLLERATAAFGIQGARNNIFFTAYYGKSEPITGAGVAIPPILGGQNNNTQMGGGAVWTHSLTPTSSLSLSGNISRTDANPPFSGRTDNMSLRFSITRPISPKTTTFAGARYSKFESDFQNNYNEAAVFVGASHSFE